MEKLKTEIHMNTIFNTIGGIMTSIICYIVPILPGYTAEEKESMKQVIKSNSFSVGMISLIAMLLVMFVLPMLLPKYFKTAFSKAKRTYRKARKRMRRRR